MFIIATVLTIFQTYYDSEAKVAARDYPKWELIGSNPVSLTFRISIDGSSLSIDAAKCPARDLDKAWELYNTSSRYEPWPDKPFSGLPLATHVQAYESEGTLRLSVRNGDTFATLILQRKGVGPRGNVTWKAADRDGDRTDVEGAMRKLIALVEGRWSSSTTDAKVNGARLAARRGRGGLTMVSLEDWAHAMGTDVTWNRRLGSATFQCQGEVYIVALGARAVKVGGDWRAFDDTVMLYGGKWYVPVGQL